MPRKTKIGTEVALVTRTPLSRSKGQGHQAALLSAALRCKAAAALSVGTYSTWESTATLRLLGGARGARAATGRRGAGAHCVATRTACLNYLLILKAGESQTLMTTNLLQGHRHSDEPGSFKTGTEIKTQFKLESKRPHAKLLKRIIRTARIVCWRCVNPIRRTTAVKRKRNISVFSQRKLRTTLSVASDVSCFHKPRFPLFY